MMLPITDTQSAFPLLQVRPFLLQHACIEFPMASAAIYALEPNYLDVIDLDLYFPNEVENIQLPRKGLKTSYRIKKWKGKHGFRAVFD